MLADLTIKDFLEKTSSNSPVPGGGSIAALSGAISASLLEMVANLTIGKKGYEEFEEEMKEISAAVLEYRKKLIADIDKDSDAYNTVMSAYKLPKGTDEEKRERSKAIQDGLKRAALVPLGVAKDAFEIIKMAEDIVKKGNHNAITDGAVAVLMAKAAVLGALYNVKINLGFLKDKDFIVETSTQVKNIENQIEEIEKNILKNISL